MTENTMYQAAYKIVKTLQNKNYEAVFAGGYIRDKLLSQPIKDIDIATSATPDEIEKTFKKTLAVGKDFGVILVIEDGMHFEVATFRNDGSYTDGRRPDSVEFVSMKEDAIRRDFPINGMFYDPIKDKIYDFVNGQQDLEAKIVRFIGNPYKRIKEDKLRLLRAVRFCSRLGFNYEEQTWQAIKENASKIMQVSNERIFSEIIKTLQGRNFRKSINDLMNSGLMQYILPEVAAMDKIEQPPQFHPEGDVLEHTIIALEYLPKTAGPELLMATLLHDIGKPPTMTITDRIRFNEHDKVGAKMAKELLKRLKCSKRFTDYVVELITAHMRFKHVMEMRKSTLKKLMRLNNFNDHLELHRADCLSSHGMLDNYEFVKAKIKEFKQENEQIRPERLVTGDDLVEMGLKPGPQFKDILEKIEIMQLEGEVRNREEALRHLHSLNRP